MLNDAGLVSEGSGMNLFTVSKEVVYTPPVSSGILEDHAQHRDRIADG